MIPEYVTQYENLERNHWWWLARRRILLRILRSLIGNRENRAPTLLDVGCGAGMNLAAFKDLFDCRGLEPDPHLAARAEVNSGVAIHRGTLGNLGDIEGSRFDFILLLDVLEHLEDDEGALKACARLLAPGGKIIVTVPAMRRLWSVHDAANQHKRRYELESLGGVIERAGLEADLIRYWNCALIPLAYLERSLFKRRHKKRNYRVEVPGPFSGRLLAAWMSLEFPLTGLLKPPFGLSLLAVAGAAPAALDGAGKDRSLLCGVS